MTIKKIADVCGIANTRWEDSEFIVQDMYTEADIEKMLRYVAMKVAKIAAQDGKINSTKNELEAIVDQVLGDE